MENLRGVVRGVERNWEKVEKRIERYGKLQEEMGELLYWECVVKVASPDYILTPVLKVRWEEEVDLEPLRMALESFMKDFNKKLRGLSKG